jgi:hypothetical protein
MILWSWDSRAYEPLVLFTYLLNLVVINFLFLLFNCENSSYILDIYPLSDTLFASLFIFLMISFNT